MTRSRIFASRTHHYPVVFSGLEDKPGGSQELTSKEGATVINPTLPTPAPLMLLLVVYLAWSLELD